MTLSHNRGRFSVVIEVGSVKNHRRITGTVPLTRRNDIIYNKVNKKRYKIIIDRISVKGYRSFKVLSLKLRKINLLLCSNGAGHENTHQNYSVTDHSLFVGNLLRKEKRSKGHDCCSLRDVIDQRSARPYCDDPHQLCLRTRQRNVQWRSHLESR